MSNEDDTPESDLEMGEDLASLEVDPDELPEGEESDPDVAVAEDDESNDTTEVAVSPDSTEDNERLHLDDTDTTPRKRPKREESDENEFSSVDDEEADLATILAEKLRSGDDLPPEDDTEVVDLEDATDGTPLLQPRRPDEEHCQQCFLLVRKSAPKCPVDHDLCPLFPA
jgi:hypothetical protein